MTALDRDLLLALDNYVRGIPDSAGLKSYKNGAMRVAGYARQILEDSEIPHVGPCASCEYHEINRPDGVACAAGECIEQEAI